MGSTKLYYHGFDRMIIHEKNITPEFFDLKNRMAGEILQKFSNYRIRLAIVGDRTQQLTGAGERRMQINNVHPVVVAATIRRLLKLRIPAEEDSMAISYVCNNRAYFSA
ncbi:MAG: DUF4180 domain-containing protein [Bacteroidales bacterium]|nr:DUF4180 domain-containing protein [Bacteroidales bacterium]